VELLRGVSPAFNRGETFSGVKEHTNLLKSGILLNPGAHFSPQEVMDVKYATFSRV
jgi:hypothetical protein